MIKLEAATRLVAELEPAHKKGLYTLLTGLHNNADKLGKLIEEGDAKKIKAHLTLMAQVVKSAADSL